MSQDANESGELNLFTFVSFANSKKKTGRESLLLWRVSLLFLNPFWQYSQIWSKDEFETPETDSTTFPLLDVINSRFGDRAAIGWLDMDLYREGFEDSPESEAEAVCFHPSGVNTYCDQPNEGDEEEAESVSYSHDSNIEQQDEEEAIPSEDDEDEDEEDEEDGDEEDEDEEEADEGDLILHDLLADQWAQWEDERQPVEETTVIQIINNHHHHHHYASVGSSESSDPITQAIEAAVEQMREELTEMADEMVEVATEIEEMIEEESDLIDTVIEMLEEAEVQLEEIQVEDE